MVIARNKLVDPEVTAWYLCQTTVTRGAPSLTTKSRREFIAKRLEELSGIFCISIHGYKLIGRRMHFLVKLQPEAAEKLTAEQVAKRWGKLVPPRSANRVALPVSKSWVSETVGDAERVAELRRRLCDLGTLMKWFKEPLSRLVNKEEGESGTLFEARFRSMALLDEPAVVATCEFLGVDPSKSGVPASRRNSKKFAEQVEVVRYHLSCFENGNILGRFLAADEEAMKTAAAKLGSGVRVWGIRRAPSKDGE